MVAHRRISIPILYFPCNGIRSPVSIVRLHVAFPISPASVHSPSGSTTRKEPRRLSRLLRSRTVCVRLRRAAVRYRSHRCCEPRLTTSANWIASVHASFGHYVYFCFDAAARVASRMAGCVVSVPALGVWEGFRRNPGAECGCRC